MLQTDLLRDKLIYSINIATTKQTDMKLMTALSLKNPFTMPIEKNKNNDKMQILRKPPHQK